MSLPLTQRDARRRLWAEWAAEDVWLAIVLGLDEEVALMVLPPPPSVADSYRALQDAWFAEQPDDLSLDLLGPPLGRAHPVIVAPSPRSRPGPLAPSVDRSRSSGALAEAS